MNQPPESSGLPAGEPPPGRIALAPGVHVPIAAVQWRFARSSGPGGQNVNKLNTKAELWVPLDAIAGLSPAALARLRVLASRRLTLDGRIHLVDQTSRSQQANRQRVLERLGQMLAAAAVEPRPRRKTRPSRAARQRRLDAKRRRADVKRHRSSGASERE
jgi:ribosome-associated protein